MDAAAETRRKVPWGTQPFGCLGVYKGVVLNVDEAGESRSSPGASRSADDFSALVSPHLAAMANLAARLAGGAQREDVVQDALSRAWQRWETYDADRGSPRTWLLAIVADRARRSRRRLPRLTTRSAAAAVMPQETDVDLERAIDRLPRRQRMAVELHYFVGLTTSETASVMSCAEGTVKSALHDARSNLRRALEQP